MAVTHFESVGRPHIDAYEVRTIGTADLKDALREGWADFMDRRGDLLFIGIVYPLIGLIAAIVALQGSLLYLLFPIATGIGLLGPAAAVGFYELARRRDRGLASDWSHFLDVVKRPAFDSILAVATLLVVIFAAWLVAAAALYLGLMGPEPVTVGSFLTRLFTTVEGWALILIGNLVGLMFSALVLAVSVVSMPMLVDKDVGARAAVGTSVEAVRLNTGVMARWGLIVAGLLVLGSIPFFVGLAVVLPVLGYSTWHLYTKVVVR